MHTKVVTWACERRPRYCVKWRVSCCNANCNISTNFSETLKYQISRIYPSSCSPDLTCGQTDMEKVIDVHCNFCCERAKWSILR